MKLALNENMWLYVAHSCMSLILFCVYYAVFLLGLKKCQNLNVTWVGNLFIVSWLLYDNGIVYIYRKVVHVLEMLPGSLYHQESQCLYQLSNLLVLVSILSLLNVGIRYDYLNITCFLFKVFNAKSYKLKKKEVIK